MTEEKRIEEMANIMRDNENCCQATQCPDCKYKDCDVTICIHMLAAETFYNAGYRKTSEIFEELEKLLLNNHIESFKNYHDEWVHRFKENMLAKFIELKKKYTESENDK